MFCLTTTMTRGRVLGGLSAHLLANKIFGLFCVRPQQIAANEQSVWPRVHLVLLHLQLQLLQWQRKAFDKATHTMASLVKHLSQVCCSFCGYQMSHKSDLSFNYNNNTLCVCVCVLCCVFIHLVNSLKKTLSQIELKSSQSSY